MRIADMEELATGTPFGRSDRLYAASDEILIETLRVRDAEEHRTMEAKARIMGQAEMQFQSLVADDQVLVAFHWSLNKTKTMEIEISRLGKVQRGQYRYDVNTCIGSEFGETHCCNPSWSYVASHSEKPIHDGSRSSATSAQEILR